MGLANALWIMAISRYATAHPSSYLILLLSLCSQLLLLLNESDEPKLTVSVIIGIGSGLSLVTVPLLLSEISTRSSKTLFGTLHQMSIGIGMILAQSLSFVFSRPWRWRYVLLVGFGIATALFALSGILSVRPRKGEGAVEFGEEGEDEDDEERPLVQREEVKQEVSVRELLHADTIVKRGSESSFSNSWCP